MCGRHSAGPKRRFGLGNKGFVDFLEDEVQRVAGPSPESVAHETCDPNRASFVEGKSVGERSSAQCDNRLGRSEVAVRTQREADQTSAERLDGVEPTAGRIDTDFVGVVEPSATIRAPRSSTSTTNPSAISRRHARCRGRCLVLTETQRRPIASGVTKFVGGTSMPSTCCRTGRTEPSRPRRHTPPVSSPRWATRNPWSPSSANPLGFSANAPG